MQNYKMKKCIYFFMVLGKLMAQLICPLCQLTEYNIENKNCPEDEKKKPRIIKQKKKNLSSLFGIKKFFHIKQISFSLSGNYILDKALLRIYLLYIF